MILKFSQTQFTPQDSISGPSQSSVSQLKTLHQSKMMNREQSLQEDAKVFAVMCVENKIEDPFQMMNRIVNSDQYWAFVKKNDQRYWKDVARLADGLASKFRSHPELLPPPPPKPQGGKAGGAGGGGGLLGSFNLAKMVKESQKMFLFKKDGDYKLKNSLLVKLISGKMEYLKSDGGSFKLLMSKKDTIIDRNHSLVAINEFLERELPSKLKSLITAKLKELDLHSAESFSEYILNMWMKTGIFDFKFLHIPLINDSGNVFLLHFGDGLEPETLTDIRKEIGLVFNEYIERIKYALASLEIKVTEFPSQMPIYTTIGLLRSNKKNELDSPEIDFSPSLLKDNEVDETVNVKALLLTANHQESSEELKIKCLNRIVYIICNYPQIYQKEKLSEGELNILKQRFVNFQILIDEIVKFDKLFNSDDADFMFQIVQRTEKDTYLFSKMISSQNRESIIKALPELCICDENINLEYFLKLDASEQMARQTIKRVFQLHLEKKINAIDFVIRRKMMECLMSSFDHEMIELCQKDKYLCCFLILQCIKNGSIDLISEILVSNKYKKIPYFFKLLVGTEIIKLKDGALNRLIKEAFSLYPNDLKLFNSQEEIIEYMKVNRINWNGHDLPNYDKLLSLPEDPFELSKSLMTINDTHGLIALMQLCNQELSKKDNKSLKTIIDSIKSHIDGKMSEILGNSSAKLAAILPKGELLIESGGFFVLKKYDGIVSFASKKEDSLKNALKIIKENSLH